MSRIPQRHGVSLAAPTGTRSGLRRGSTGAQVRELQRKLQALRYLSASDVATGPGVFGPRTESAVKQFQVAHGLRATGVVGQYTQAALARAMGTRSSNVIDQFAVGANQRHV